MQCLVEDLQHKSHNSNCKWFFMTAIKGRWLSIIESLSFYVKAPRKKSLYTIPAEAWDDNLLLLVQDDIGFQKELLAFDLSSWSRLNTSASLLPVKVLLSTLTTLPLWPSLLFSHSYWHINFCIVSVCCSPISYLSISFICVVSFCVRHWIFHVHATVYNDCSNIMHVYLLGSYSPRTHAATSDIRCHHNQHLCT